VQVRLERTTIMNGRRGWPLVAVVALLFAMDGVSAQQVPSTPNAAAPVTVRGLAVRIDTLLDLPSVIERARAASPVIAQAEEGLRIARSQVRVATGAYLPSVSANSAAGASTGSISVVNSRYGPTSPRPSSML